MLVFCKLNVVWSEQLWKSCARDFESTCDESDAWSEPHACLIVSLYA